MTIEGLKAAEPAGTVLYTLNARRPHGVLDPIAEIVRLDLNGEDDSQQGFALRDADPFRGNALIAEVSVDENGHMMLIGEKTSQDSPGLVRSLAEVAMEEAGVDHVELNAETGTNLPEAFLRKIGAMPITAEPHHFGFDRQPVAA